MGDLKLELKGGWDKKPRRTVEHDGRDLKNLAHIARLLFELAHRRLLGRLARVDEAGRHLDRDLVDRRAELPLQYYLGA